MVWKVGLVKRPRFLSPAETKWILLVYIPEHNRQAILNEIAAKQSKDCPSDSDIGISIN